LSWREEKKVLIKKSRYRNDSSTCIPDCWSGKRILVPTVITKETEHYISLPARRFFLSENCKKITLMSSNKFFISGIKFLLERVTNLSLTIHYDFNHCHKFFTNPDSILILSISNKLELYKFYKMLLNNTNHYKHQPIIICTSENIESELNHLAKIFDNMNVLSLKSGMNIIEKSIFSPSFEKGDSSFNHEKLTERQAEILSLFAKGLSIKKIASQLGVKPGTVYTLKRRALNKVGVCNKSFEAIFHEHHVTHS